GHDSTGPANGEQKIAHRVQKSTCGAQASPLYHRASVQFCTGLRGMRMHEETPLTISVPEAGKRYFGLCRNASYEAAARGESTVARIGRLLRVPVRALERMLDRAGEPTP